MSEKNQEPVELITESPPPPTVSEDATQEQQASAACAKTSTHHSFNAHMITGIAGRDANAVLVAPQIDNILEEDEEEEVEKNVETKTESVEVVAPQEPQEPIVAPVQPAQHTPIKFILEPVVLNLNENPTTSNANKKESDKTTPEPNISDVVVEFKVEEGYATRQMDENFRQTIAAIKEELTKKLETKKERFDPDGDG